MSGHVVESAAAEQLFEVDGYELTRDEYAAYVEHLRTPPRRGWDIVLTVIMLMLAVAGAGLGCLFGVRLPAVLDRLAAEEGVGLTEASGSAGITLVVTHVVLLGIALGLSIPLLVRGRVVVFWIPLTIGAAAAIMFWVTLVLTVSGETALVNAMEHDPRLG
jgi:hypothetical protein